MIVPRRKNLLIGVAILAGLAAVFSQLPIRPQGRIVEIVTFEELPLEWALRRNFVQNQNAVAAIFEFMNEQPDGTKVSISPIGNLTASVREQTFNEGIDYPNILQAIQEIRAQFVNKDEYGVSIFLGIENRRRGEFWVSYASPTGNRKIPPCVSIDTNARKEWGYCGMKLDETWYLLYEWMPDNY